MRATRHRPAPISAVDDHGPARRDVIVRPAPLAMVWQGIGVPHAAIAVPGVSLGHGDVLVAIELATVCPIDAATVAGEGKVAVPLVLGHEQVGRIVAIGDGAETADGARLIVGMRVVWARRIGCGVCEACRSGSPSGCETAREYGADRLRRGWELSGGFATHVLLRSGTTIVAVPEIVPAAVLAPVPCATALAAAAVESLMESTEVDGERVVVLGADLIGLTAAAMLADEGASVVVVDADPVRRSRARDFGATAVAADLAAVTDDGARIVAAVESGEDRRAEAAALPELAALPEGTVVARVGHAHPHAQPGPHPRPHAHPHGHGHPRAHGHGQDARSATREASTGPVVIDRSDPSHLAAAVAFVSNAWYRYPFEELVAVRYPLDRLDDAIAAASGTSVLRVGVDPVLR